MKSFSQISASNQIKIITNQNQIKSNRIYNIYIFIVYTFTGTIVFHDKVKDKIKVTRYIA